MAAAAVPNLTNAHDQPPSSPANQISDTSSRLRIVSNCTPRALNDDAVPTVAASTFSAPSPPLDPNRDPQPLPRYKKNPMIYVYQHVPVDKEYHVRAQEIIKVFRENVFVSRARLKNGNYLRDQRHLIDYGVKMCGPSKDECKTSIVVFCNKDILPPLKSVLTKDHVRAQYSSNVPSDKPNVFDRFVMRRNSPVEGVSKAGFNLYFWPAPKPRELLWCATSSIRHRKADEFSAASCLTMCGAEVYPINKDPMHSVKSSRIGCLIEVDSHLYGLTSAHGYRTLTDDFPVGFYDGRGNGNSDTGTECKQRNPSIVIVEDDDINFDDDDDYDMSSEDDASNQDLVPNGEHAVNETDTDPFQSQALHEYGKDNSASQNITIVPDDGDDGLGGDLDWAAIRIDNPQQRLPNAYLMGQDTTQLRYIATVAHQQPDTATSVHIISAAAVAKPGILVPGTSNLGGLRGQIPCEVWNVSLQNPTDIRKGDSGALVVDAKTHAVFGHVVACNPFGEIYIVPFSETLKQIQKVFKTSKVRLPQPLPLLTELAALYLDSKHALARTAIAALVDLAFCTGGAEKRQPAASLNSSMSSDTLLDLAMDLSSGGLVESHINCHLNSRSSLSNMCQLLRHDKQLFKTDWSTSIVPEILAAQACFLSTPFQQACHEINDFRLLSLPQRSANISPYLDPCSSGKSSLENSQESPPVAFEIKCDFPTYGFTNDQICQQSKVTDGYLECFRKSSSRIADGGFSSVYQVELNHYLNSGASIGQAAKVAMKRIRTTTVNSSRWKYESENLRFLQRFKNPHIIELIESFECDDSHWLVFPLAKCDLDAYMTSEPPSPNANFSRWMFKEMMGICDALQLIHTGLGGGGVLCAHMDIKPANVLILESSNAPSSERNSSYGTFVLADFGLSILPTTKNDDAFGLRRSEYARSRVDRQYAPPEAEIPDHTRFKAASFDVWSFGCIWLEICTWLQFGAKRRKRFLEELSCDAIGDVSSFYNIDRSASDFRFSLNPRVSSLLRSLQNTAFEDAILHAAVRIVTISRILDPNPKKRPTALEIRHKIHASLDSADNGIEYGALATDTPVWTRTWVYQTVHLSNKPEHVSTSSPKMSENSTSRTGIEMTSLSASTDTIIKPPGAARPPSKDDKPRSSHELTNPHSLHKPGTTGRFFKRRDADSSGQAYNSDSDTCIQREHESFSEGSDSTHKDTASKFSPVLKHGLDLCIQWGQGLHREASAHSVTLKQKCPYCEVFGRPVALMPHIRSQHRKEHPKQCSKCGRLLACREDLVDHHLQTYSEAFDALKPKENISGTTDPAPSSVRGEKGSAPLLRSVTPSTGRSETMADSLVDSPQPSRMISGGVTRYGQDSNLGIDENFVSAFTPRAA